MRGAFLAGWILVAVAAPAQALEIGDRLPSSGTVAWVTAPPSQAHPRVQLTVCLDAAAPDNRAVMARITDLAHRHPDAGVVVYSASSEDSLRDLTHALGARCGVPVGRVESLTPYQPPVGLPWAVLSDQNGTVVWYGHPLDSAEPLVGALEGIWQVEIPHPLPALDAADPAAGVPPAEAGPRVAPPPPSPAWVEPEDDLPPRETTLIIGGPWWCWAPHPWGWCWGRAWAPVPRVPFRALPHR